MKKLGGWQRLWVLAMLVWACALTAMFFDEATNQSVSFNEVKEHIASESVAYIQDAGTSLNLPFNRNNINVEEGVQVFAWPAAEKAKNRSFYVLNLKSGLEFKIKDTGDTDEVKKVFQDIKFAITDAQIDKEKSNIPGLMIIFIFTSIGFYIFGALIGWVCKGFKKT